MIKKTIVLSLLLATGISAHANQAMPQSEQSQPTSLSSMFGQKKSKFLPVYEAFKVKAVQDGDKLMVHFDVTPEHYVYQDKLSLTLPEGVSASAWQFNKTPNMIDDPEFGRVAVFETDVVATAVLASKVDLKDENIRIKWQGCAKAGLCYPPETVNVAVNLTAKSANKSANNQPRNDLGKKEEVKKDEVVASRDKFTQVTDNAPANANANDSSTHANMNANTNTPKSPLVSVVQSGINSPTDSITDVDSNLTDVPKTTLNEGLGGVLATEDGVADLFGATDDGVADFQTSDTNDLVTGGGEVEESTQNTQLANPPTLTHTTVTTDPFGIQKNPVWALVLLFMAGLVLSLTPCVYPMIPIVANIVARGQNKTNAKKGFMLSASYGVGVAVAYGVLGAVVAWFGQALGVTSWLQNPYVLGVFALIFGVLGVAMFDVIQLRLPSFISNRLQNQAQKGDDKLGSVSGSFVAGALSALVVSPCVSLPMAGALTAVSVSGSVALGFFALFLFGLGLSLPLMLMGAVQGKFMPKAGDWMNCVKEFCGLLLLAVAVSLLERMIFSSAILIIWAVWFALVAVWLFRVGKLLAQAVGLLAGAWAICLMMGAGMGNTDAWRPLTNLHQVAQNSIQKADLKITTLNELDEILTKHDKVLVDITAEWCIECRIMERTLFANRPVVLSDYQVVKLDITETTDDSRAVLARYQLFGPPALIIYQGGQLKEVLLGEVKRADFEMALAKY